MKYYITFIFAFIFLNVIKLNANEPVVLQYADSVVGFVESNASIRDFAGNVQMRQGTMIMKCNKAREFLGTNIVEMTGNVEILQGQMLLKAPFIRYDGNKYTAFAPKGVTITDRGTFLQANSGIYNTKLSQADFKGDVLVEDDSVVIFAQYIRHFRTNGNSYANGNVVILGKESNVIFSADTAINIPDSNYSIGFGNPLLIQIDSTAKYVTQLNDTIFDEPILYKYEYDTLSVKADTIQAYQHSENEYYIFNNNVEIVKNNVSATSGLARYNKSIELFNLDVEPVVWFDSTQLHSDSIIIYLHEQKLSKIEMYGNSLVATRDDTTDIDRINQIVGDTIFINFKDGDINDIYSYGNSQTLYFILNDDGSSTIDRKNTDDVRVEFSMGEVLNIYWLGKSTAEYHPESIVFKKAKEFYLPSFRWKEKRPEMTYFSEEILKILKFLKIN